MSLNPTTAGRAAMVSQCSSTSSFLIFAAEVVGVQRLPGENLLRRGHALVPFRDELVPELLVYEQVFARNPFELVGFLVALDGFLQGARRALTFSSVAISDTAACDGKCTEASGDDATSSGSQRAASTFPPPPRVPRRRPAFGP